MVCTLVQHERNHGGTTGVPMDDRQRDAMRAQIRAFRLAVEDMALVTQAGEAILWACTTNCAGCS